MNRPVRSIGLLLAAASLGAQAAPVYEGRWEGTIAVPGAPIALVLDLAPAPGSGWIGSVVLSGFGIKGAPVGDVVVTESSVRLTFPTALRADGSDAPVLTARSLDAQTLAGEFQQAGLRAPLRLTRTGAAQVERPPASTPITAALIGTWIGCYDLGGYPRQVTLTLSMEVDAPRAEMVIVGKRTTNVPFGLIRQGEHFLTLKANDFGISFEGEWRTPSDEIAGTFQQGPFEVPLTLRRAVRSAS